jgi:hypothetical protein
MDLKNVIDRRRWLRRCEAGARSHAGKKGFVYALPDSHAEALWKCQDGRCAVTNIAFHAECFEKALVKYPYAPSIDRRDPFGGYAPDNVRLVCIGVNFGMGQWGEVVFLTLAQAAVEFDKTPRPYLSIDQWRAQQQERITAAGCPDKAGDLQ